MPNIRIKDIPTTASATSSTDFIGIDGSANGTRKLDAYNPTFGGNLTVNGTGTSSFASNINVNKSTAVVDIGDGTTGPNFRLVSSVTGDANAYLQIGKSSADTNANLIISRYSTGSTAINSASIYATTTLLSGNLTVSGTGTSSFASGSKLGVGTTSPGVTFVAVGAPATLNYTIGSTSLADIRSTSAAATNAGPSLTFSGYYQTSVNTSTYGAIKGILQGTGDGNSAAGALTFLTANGAGSLSEWARLTNSGNLLLGTTTDSGNGKLQLATHTTSAGGIGFGTDISAFRATNSILSFVGGQTSFQINLAGSASTTVFGTNATGGFINSAGSTSLVLQTNTTTALTLDSSQNATFAGNVRLSGTTGTITLGSTNTGTFAVDTNGILTLTGGQSGAKLAVKHGNQGIVLDPIGGSAYVNSSTGNSILQVLTNAVGGTQSILQFVVSGQSTFDIRHDGSNLLARDNTAGYYIWKSPQGLTSSTGYFQVLTTTPSSSTTTGALVVSGGVGVAGAVNVGGAIAIGNTVNTVSPTSPNRTITMVIGGTTYYIHAKTTND